MGQRVGDPGPVTRTIQRDVVRGNPVSWGAGQTSGDGKLSGFSAFSPRWNPCRSCDASAPGGRPHTHSHRHPQADGNPSNGRRCHGRAPMPTLAIGGLPATPTMQDSPSDLEIVGCSNQYNHDS